jgi:hypothetical protein
MEVIDQKISHLTRFGIRQIHDQLDVPNSVSLLKISDVISFRYKCPLGSEQYGGSLNQESRFHCFERLLQRFKRVSYYNGI